MRKKFFKKANSFMALSLAAMMGITSLSPAVSVSAASENGKYYGNLPTC